LQDWRVSRALQGHGIEAAADRVDSRPHVHGVWEDRSGNIQTHGTGVCRQTRVMWYVELRPFDFANQQVEVVEDESCGCFVKEKTIIVFVKYD